MFLPTWYVVLSLIVVGWQAFLLLMAFFEPPLRYRIESFSAQPINSDDFLKTLEALTDAQVNHRCSLTVLPNGERFYEAQLQAIRNAKRSINLEAYIFQRGQVAERYLDVLEERARSGVKVNLVLDGIGSFSCSRKYCRKLIEAGGRVEFYHPFSWRSIARVNNRTHREVLIIDGEVAFIGGAGIADHWLLENKGQRRWRDTVVRVEGDVVPNLQSTFAENWLEACGELIFGEDYFQFPASKGSAKAMVVNSSPSAGGSTRARILFQALVSGARQSINITTPYFLPDSGMLKELERASQRGVKVKVLVPGKKSDHGVTRSSSRRLYGKLLEAGVRIFEYQPAMIHAKILIVDGVWSVVGSTNFDNRSFGLNDEVNLGICDSSVAATLASDYASDLEASREITLDDWKRRPLLERLHEALGWAVQRQQ